MKSVPAPQPVQVNSPSIQDPNETQDIEMLKYKLWKLQHPEPAPVLTEEQKLE